MLSVIPPAEIPVQSTQENMAEFLEHYIGTCGNCPICTKPNDFLPLSEPHMLTKKIVELERINFLAETLQE